MEEICRLCLTPVKKACTTIQHNEFRQMMDAVFSFPIFYKEALPKHVCPGCSRTVRNFFIYTLKVKKMQSYIIREGNDTITDSFERNEYDEAYLEEENSMDAVMSSTWRDPSTPLDDPLSVNSTIKLPTQPKVMENKTSFNMNSTTDKCYTKCLRSQKIKCITKSSSLHADLPFSCSECDLKLATKIQLYKHRRVHQKKECPACNMLFRADKLKDHFAKMHPHHKLLIAKQEFRCENCQELFDTEAQLHGHAYHNRVQDCPEMPSLPLDGKGSTIKLEDDAIKERIYRCTKRYKCCKCEDKFVDKVQLVKHQRLHRTVECPACGKTFRTDRIKHHIAKRHPNAVGSGQKLFRCTECKKLFINAVQLASHAVEHKKKECPVCKETASDSHISKHLDSLTVVEGSDNGDDFSISLNDVDVTITED